MEFTLSRVSREVTERHFDVLIIGAGAAGLSAAVYSARSGLSVLILDKSAAGGLTAESPLVENYLGFKSVNGTELAVKFTAHAREYAEILENTEVVSVEPHGDFIAARTNRGEFTGKALIIATGTSHKNLNVQGEKQYYGKGVSYCSTCDGYLFRNKKVAVIGGGNSGAIAALSMNEYAYSATIIEYMDRYMCESAYVKAIQESGILYRRNSKVLEIAGDGKRVKAVRFKDRKTGEEVLMETDGVFIYVGLSPQTEFLEKSGVVLDEKGYVVVDQKGRTSINGIYSAGDVTKGNEAQIATAVGDGCRVALAISKDMIHAGGSREP